MTSYDPAQFTRGFDEMRRILAAAWQKDLVAGFSGNASLKLADGNILLTAKGAAKGRLLPSQVCIATPEGKPLAGAPASSEAGMHYALYAARPDCGAILHTHPPFLLALAMLSADMAGFLKLPLFEADVFRKKLAIAPALSPGTQELALAVAEAAEAPRISAVWMSGHGLCAFGGTLDEALALTEEYEHLARVALLAQG